MRSIWLVRVLVCCVRHRSITGAGCPTIDEIVRHHSTRRAIRRRLLLLLARAGTRPHYGPRRLDSSFPIRAIDAVSRLGALSPEEAGNPGWNRDTHMAGPRCSGLRGAKGSGSTNHCLARRDWEIPKRLLAETGASRRSGKVPRLENHDSSNCRSAMRTRLRSPYEEPGSRPPAESTGDGELFARGSSRRSGASPTDRKHPVSRSEDSRFRGAKEKMTWPGTRFALERPVSGSPRYPCRSDAHLLPGPNSSICQYFRDS